MAGSIPLSVVVVIAIVVSSSPGHTKAKRKTKDKAFAKTDKEIRLYTTCVDLTENLLDRHAKLPTFSCVASYLPTIMNGIKPGQTLQYDVLRKKLASRLKELNPRKAKRQILMKIPEPCEDSNRAAGRIKTMRSKLLGELETILTTSVLVLEKHDFLAKAKKYRKLYRHYFPRKNLEKEFEKKYLKP